MHEAALSVVTFVLCDILPVWAAAGRMTLSTQGRRVPAGHLHARGNVNRIFAVLQAFYLQVFLSHILVSYVSGEYKRGYCLIKRDLWCIFS